MLETDFDVTSAVADLGQLETMLAGDEVQLFEVRVTGEAAVSRGICVTLGAKRPITEPAPPPRDTTTAVDPDDEVRSEQDFLQSFSTRHQSWFPARTL